MIIFNNFEIVKNMKIRKTLILFVCNFEKILFYMNMFATRCI